MALSREQELRLRAAARRRRETGQQPGPPQAQSDPLGLERRQAETGGRSAFDRFSRGMGTSVFSGIPMPFTDHRLGPSTVVGAGLEAANLLGADVENTSGDDFIRRYLAPLGLTFGPGENPSDTLAGAVGEAVGGVGLPGAAATGVLARQGAGLVSGVARAPQATRAGRIADVARESAARAPGATMSAEVTGAAGEAASREIAEDEFGEGSWQSTMASITGGIVGGLGPTSSGRALKGAVSWGLDNLPIATAARNAVTNFFNLKPPAGATARARERVYGRVEKGERVGGVVTDPDTARAGLRGQTDVEQDVLTPAQLTEDPGIMSLAARDRADDPALMASWRGQVDETMGTLRQRLQNLTGEERQAIEAQYHDQLDNMITVAGLNAQRRLANMTPEQSRAEYSRVMQQELVDALHYARREETALWNQVPDDMLMPAEVAREAYNRLRSQLGEITQRDMPEVARRFLDPDSPETWLPKAEPGVQDTVTLGRLRELRSALLDEARNAGSGSAPNYNRARLARELAQSLRDDILDLDLPEGPGIDAYRTATAFSKRLNDRFNTGPVSRVLKKDRQGRYAVQPERAMDVTVGRGGVEARQSTKGFVRALESPSPAAKAAFNGYLEDDFLRMATLRGQGEELVEAGADRFMAKYRDLFEQMPNLRQRFQEAIDSGNLAIATRSLREGDPLQMKARDIREIRRLTRGDETGAVWQGFRERFTEKLIDRITMQPSKGTGGMNILSGNRLRSFMNDPQIRPALEQVYTTGELKALNRYANTLSLIERDIMAQPAGALATNQPGVARTVLARLMGAGAGQKVGTAMGGGAGMNLQAAQIGSGLFKRLVESGLRTPVAKLISDSLKNKQLLDALLVPANMPRDEVRNVAVVNAWLVDALDKQAEQSWGLGSNEDRRQGFERRPRETGQRPGPPIPEMPTPPGR